MATALDHRHDIEMMVLEMVLVNDVGMMARERRLAGESVVEKRERERRLAHREKAMGLGRRDGIESVVPEKQPLDDIDIALGEARGRALDGMIRNLRGAELVIQPGGDAAGADIALEVPARLPCSFAHTVEALARHREHASCVLRGVPAKLLDCDGRDIVTQVCWNLYECATAAL
jgi:uncharacterized protein YqgQ